MDSRSAQRRTTLQSRGSTQGLARWYVLLALSALYALSIADRYAISTVLESVRADLRLTDSGIAFLTGTALALFYVAFGIPLAWAADRWNRVRLIAASIIGWSAMTSWTGLASSFGQLLASRIGVGIGEAGATPAASSLIADYFGIEQRPMALTVFSLGAPVGAWIAATLGGAVAQHWGWRSTFLVLAVPGAMLGLLIALTLREPQRGTLDPQQASPCAPTLLETWRVLLRHPPTVHLLAAVALTTLWGWGMMWWIPALLNRAYAMDVGAAGALLGRQHLAGGVGATLLASWLFSRPRFATNRAILGVLSAIVLLGSGLSIALLLTRSLSTTARLLWLFVPAIYLYIGPTMALLNNFVPPAMRAVALASSLFLANICNLVIAPQLIGWLSDLYSAGVPDAESLRRALLWIAPTGAWAALHYRACSRALRRQAPR